MAIQLNATDIHLTSPVTTFPNRSLPMSLLCWVNSASWGVETASMVGVYLSRTTGIQIGSRLGSTGIEVWTWGGGQAISTNGIYAPVSNTWLHIAYIWDGSINYIYANGELITTSTNAPVAGVLTQIYINGYPTGGLGEVSNTLVEDVAFYDRALSADEVSTIVSTRGYKDGIYNGLLARYCFNELPAGSTMTSVIDYSGNNLFLTATGPGTIPTYVVGGMASDTRAVLG